MNAGILTKKDIQARGLIKNPQPGRLQDTSYDLTLGSEYQNDDGNIHTLSQDGKLVIPSCGVVLVSTKEIVETDSRTAGRFDLKIRHALRGLVLQVGTQVEPNYSGPLFGLILNLSSKDVKIFEGEDILTIEFHTLTSPVERPPERITGLRDFLQHENITDPVESSLTRIKADIFTSLDSKLKLGLEQYVRSLHTDWEQRKINRQAVFLSFVVLLISLILGAGLPIYINKTTLDRDDTFYQQLRISRASQQLQNNEAFERLLRLLQEHPEAIDTIDRFLQQSGQEQPNPTPASNSSGRKKPGG